MLEKTSAHCKSNSYFAISCTYQHLPLHFIPVSSLSIENLTDGSKSASSLETILNGHCESVMESVSYVASLSDSSTRY